jgi:UDP-N-acetylglucosamine--N-acetylmuramyl-(pentapeptide) pyrophosphoryl-undecaprenol N-acetylglucosamine transferase
MCRVSIRLLAIMPNKKRIVLTGGGTAGHVLPALALVAELKERGYEIYFIGNAAMERDLAKAWNVPFFAIKAGKLRRYFSWQNFLDVFRIMVGFLQAFMILKRLKPAWYI